jgi:tetratricopeptide (TPR) repeat protein
VLAYQRRIDEADSVHLEALATAEEAVGPAHPEWAAAAEAYARFLAGQDRADEARPLLQRALEIDLEALGPDHEQTRGARADLDALDGP